MRFLHLSLAISTLILAMACGGSGVSLPPQAPTIIIQPTSQSTTVGHSATFTVSATGTEPLTYQWYWNGLLVNGATYSTFVTPLTVPSDNQSNLLVTVSNKFGNLISAPVNLTVTGSPLPPKEGDLRFKDVDAFPVTLLGGLSENFNMQLSIAGHNIWGGPLSIGWPGPNPADGNPYDTDWYFLAAQLPLIDTAPERITTYKADNLTAFSSDLSSLPSTTIVSSLDMCAPQNVFAWELVQTTGTKTFTPVIAGSVLSTDLQAIATQEGLSSRVITAVTMVGTKSTYISYGWQGDTSTIYDASVKLATIDTIQSVATSLANQGYIITAIGGNYTDGFILVGTRVKGDTTPRLIQVTAPNMIGRGYALVGYILNNNLNNPSASIYQCISEQ